MATGLSGDGEEMNAENEQDFINNMNYNSSQEVCSIMCIEQKVLKEF